MWAASLISSQAWASTAISSTTAVQAPTHRCLPVLKFRRGSTPKGHDNKEDAASTHNHKNTGVVGQAVLAAAFKSKPEPQPSHSGEGVLKPQRESQIKASPQQEDRQLRGSDVLRALQRASVQKAKQSLKQKKNTNKRDILAEGGEQFVLDDYTNSRIEPLCIKSEWGVRLEKLEKRLQEIMLLD